MRESSSTSENKYEAARRKREALRQMTAAELMRQFQDGVAEAFDVMVDRYSERLLPQLYQYLGDVSLCEDLIQETFLRVYRNRHSYEEGVGHLSAWIFTIARNLALSEYRKRERRQTRPVQFPTQNGYGEEARLGLVDESPSPCQRVSSAILGDLIQQAISEIPANFREVVVLRDVQGLDYNSIAEITNLPMGTVKSRINRGRAKIKHFLEHARSSEGGSRTDVHHGVLNQAGERALADLGKQAYEDRLRYMAGKADSATAATAFSRLCGKAWNLRDLEASHQSRLIDDYEEPVDQAGAEARKVTVEPSSEEEEEDSSLSDLLSDFEEHQRESELASTLADLVG